MQNSIYIYNMKKIYAIMRGDEVSSSSLEKWKAQEYCDIMNESKGIHDFVVADAFICQGVVIEEKYREFSGLGYLVGGVEYDSLEDFLISLGFIIV